ncbi:hypothetical protein [Mycobacteroides abscessus]|uniref:LppU/SCO3897 family protein n=2 Tax=Mycobacteroides abscessus TaxID=36809 RepID=UPI0010427315|nr:hypothetical protein [Mycobacteroides abscessus]
MPDRNGRIKMINLVKRLAPPLILLAIYLTLTSLWQAYKIPNWPRWLLILGIFLAIALLHRWPTRISPRRQSYVSAALLAISLIVDVAVSWVLASKGTYAASYIGLGVLRIAASCLAVLGIAFFPTYFWSEDPIITKRLSERISVPGKKLGVLGGVLAAIVLVWGLAASCTSDDQPRADRNQISTEFDKIPGQLVGTNELTGTCVQLSGEAVSSPEVKKVSCESREANYRVIQVADKPSACVADADQRYFSKDVDTAITLCLDYNWSSSYCFKMKNKAVWYATRASCDDASAFPIEKPWFVVLDTTRLSQCPDGGWRHTTRKFTVCTKTIGQEVPHIGNFTTPPR